MIPDRSPITSKLIDFLKTVKPGTDVSHRALSDIAGSSKHDAKSKVYSAMKYVKTHHDMVFASIRGVGYRRLTDEEIAVHSPNGIRRVVKLRNREMKSIDCIQKPEALSDHARASIYVSKVIWAGISAATNDLKKQIDVAKIDGRATIAGIMDTMTNPALRG
jgi:hypothetical protein